MRLNIRTGSYGSLIWKPPEGFEYVKACPGGIRGYARRMWQGSTDHRGLPGAPGLVATLVRMQDLPKAEQDDDELCWGMCYGYAKELREEVVAYLDFREKDGYDQCLVDVFLQPDTTETPLSAEPDLRGVLLYVAQTDNPQYLGPLDDECVAQQIAQTVGPSGTNREYLFKMADGLRSIKVLDKHIFEVEERVRQLPGPAVSAVSAFTGDGTCAGDGGWMLQRLWDAAGGHWVEDSALHLGGDARAHGCYTFAHASTAGAAPFSSSTTPAHAHLGSQTFAQVLAQIGWPKSMATSTVVLPLSDGRAAPAAVALFPDGGALVTEGEVGEEEGETAVRRHFLLTRSAVEMLQQAQK